MQIKLRLLKEFTLTILLVLFYLSESLNKYYIFVYGEETFVARIIKAALLFICLTQLILNKGNKQNLGLIASLIIIFVIGQLSLNHSFDNLVVLNFVKYLFPLVLFAYFNETKQSKKAVSLLINVFEKIIFLNSTLILIGFFGNVYFFETYKGSRFGFNGFLVSSATSTYFYITVLFHYFIRYKTRIFYDVKRLIIFLSILLVGTKSLYIFLILFFFIYVSIYAERRIKTFILLLLLFLLITTGYYFIFEAEIFNKISEEKGILASFTSLRSVILNEKMIPFIDQNWSLKNYLFGGINDISTRPQMALFDLFYFFGAIGTLVYLLSYYKNYFNFNSSKITIIFFVIIFLISFMAGNFFINATTAIYLLILRESIIKYSIQ